jgi:tyrosinase
MRVRKNQASLTAMEKQRFVAAVLALKSSGVYDTFVSQHMGAAFDAYQGPAFCPWHREFINRFELALQGVDSTVTLPYWDWTVDDLPTASLWQPDFMGGDGRASDGQVMDGPFAGSTGNWPLFPEVDPGSPNFLLRALGVDATTLPSEEEVTTVLAITPYDSAPFDTSPPSSFRNELEGWVGPNISNRVHLWVGGTMEVLTSPNDPVFWLHYANLDRLWAQWQVAFPNEPYQPAAGARTGHNLNDPMQPFGGTTTPASVLDHGALGYCYDTEPGCSAKTKEGKDGKDHKDKERKEKIEFKELLREKPKDFKAEKLEQKEKDEHKEKQELKELKPEFKENPLEKSPMEGKSLEEVKGFAEGGKAVAENPVAPGIEERLAGVESAIGQLTHFIAPQLRPDLSRGALAAEPREAKTDKELDKLREG